MSRQSFRIKVLSFSVNHWRMWSKQRFIRKHHSTDGGTFLAEPFRQRLLAILNALSSFYIESLPLKPLPQLYMWVMASNLLQYKLKRSQPTVLRHNKTLRVTL